MLVGVTRVVVADDGVPASATCRSAFRRFDGTMVVLYGKRVSGDV